MTEFKLTPREERPATIEEHRALRDKIAALRSALDEIASLPPGSRGAYTKFERARSIAVSFLKSEIR